MDQGDDSSTTDGSYLVISDAEIHAAKYDWLAARDGADAVAPERVLVLFEYYRALISLQAQQIAEEFRAQHRAA